MQQLKVLTWNLGFGSMGANASVWFEGGKHLIPSSGKEVESNIVGIQNTLKQIDADVFFLQELSSGSLLNHWYDLRQAVQKALPDHSRSSVTNFVIPLYFDFLRNEHGMSTYVKKPFEILKKHTKLFKEGEKYYGIIPRLDFALSALVELKDRDPIVFVNTHLSSFDKYGSMRIAQFLELMDYVKSITSKGYEVIVGADWNMNIGKINFLNNTFDEDSYRMHVHDFPSHLLPKGWTTHFTTDVPTSRAASRPYVKGESTTLTIDGFICSPGIKVESLKTHDLGFVNSDHNPVEIIISV